ncbi:MAG: NADH-quinone oxidoreductase subunit L [Chroococcopsis gigantea SAG 12.99]|jgi:NAD(P)H-quinone oxidoreductase subunit 5|nr:NAD(P)H-quinone oxidoreductase subunit F [Chlorogloea purpurea SAG 13.99]MDV3000347.1 NADH-quinone oxidoreductase subunit L [Chroococcopsis gigantea SAG 12.99]
MREFLLQTSWFIPFYGLIGSILSLPWSLGIICRTGPRPAAYLNLLMTVIGLIHGSYALNAIWHRETQRLVWQWLSVADLNLSLSIELSPVSLGALEVITVVSLLAQTYALGYMEKDWSLARFYGLMGFFEAALGGIALSDSLLLSYGLLEMLTLSTYLLVGFWYAQPLVVTAARDAFLTKRVGDIILLMGLVALSSYGAGLTFTEIENWAETSPLDTFTATLIGLSLIAGPTGKCAQFPLNLWLDEAMEGPNPAGIMRNSIVVSAGAYVLIQLQPVLSLSPIASDALIVIGSVSAVGASLIALAQIDIKRALCHSTSAYLGLVFIAVGLGHVDIALLILLGHALSKALLFMSAGSIILTTSNQNITEMGGIWSRMPATTTAFVVGATGMTGLLPLGMFWTWQRWFNGTWAIHWWLVALLCFVNAFSVLNLTRVFRLVFLGKPQSKTRRTPEIPWPMAFPMVCLIVINLIAPIIPIRWNLWLSPTNPLSPGEAFMSYPFLLIMGAGLAGYILGLRLELRRAWARPTQLSLRFFQDLFAYDFYLDRVYAFTVVWAVASLSKITSWLDRYVIDGAVNLVSLFTIFTGSSLKYNVTGQSQFYVLTIVVGVCFFIWRVFNGQWSVVTNYWSSLLN